MFLVASVQGTLRLEMQVKMDKERTWVCSISKACTAGLMLSHVVGSVLFGEFFGGPLQK